MKRFASILSVVFHPPHLRRTGAVALLVGLWLTAFNEGDQIVAGQLTPALGVKIALNLLTPFVVANLGLLARQ